MNVFKDLNDEDDIYDDDGKLTYIQNALIKFVRNDPSTLRYFRSDLTLENTNMLRLERPGIELLYS